MNQDSHDSQIRELYQLLRRTDERQLPDFDDVLERCSRPPNQRPVRRLRVAVLFGTLAALLSAFLLIRSHFADSDSLTQPRIAEDKERRPPAGTTPSDNPGEIIFAHLHTAVDDYFRSSDIEAVDVPKWSVRTDSLLALNIELPINEE